MRDEADVVGMMHKMIQLRLQESKAMVEDRAGQIGAPL